MWIPNSGLTSCVKRASYTITWANYDGSILEINLKVLDGVMPSYDSNTPSRLDSETESFEFIGWDPSITAVEGDQTYTAQYRSTPLVNHDTFTIIWINSDGTILETDSAVIGNSIPTYDGETPTKASDSIYSYIISGWNPSIVPAQADTAYVAQYTSVPLSVNNIFTIIWLNYDGSLLSVSLNLEAGEIPVYQEDTLVRPADNSNSYTFSGWTPNVVPVTGNASYIANYSATPIYYSVTWVNDDDSILLESSNLSSGDIPSYTGSIPVKASDNSYHYTFSGWTPALGPITGNAVYTATYSTTPVYYSVSWLNYDGSLLLLEMSLTFGEVPSYPGTDPLKPENRPYKYLFNGWSPEIVAISGDAVYTAQFNEVPITFIVTWVNYDQTIIKVDEPREIGTLPSFVGSDPQHAEDEEHIYPFMG